MKLSTRINKKADWKLSEFFALNSSLDDASSGQKMCDELIIVRIDIFINDLQSIFQFVR